MAKIVAKIKNIDRVYLTLARKNAEKRRQHQRQMARVTKRDIPSFLTRDGSV